MSHLQGVDENARDQLTVALKSSSGLVRSRTSSAQQRLCRHLGDESDSPVSLGWLSSSNFRRIASDGRIRLAPESER